MHQNILPKPVRSAINRNAFRLAKTQAYVALKQDLEQRARTLMEQPHARINEVIAVLDLTHVVHASACGDVNHSGF
jgi:hypothetical protein